MFSGRNGNQHRQQSGRSHQLVSHEQDSYIHTKLNIDGFLFIFVVEIVVS